MKPLISQLALTAFLLLPCSGRADVYDSLPLVLSDANTAVSFEVDSTWHLIHGAVKGIEGRVWLSEPGNRSSLLGEITFPVAMFDTDNSRRDQRMREVMAAADFPLVKVKVDHLAPCNLPQCSTVADVVLSIKGVERSFKMPVKFDEPNSPQVSGSLVVRWRDFGIEDPSIIVAKLYDDVTIHFSVSLPPNKQ